MSADPTGKLGRYYTPETISSLLVSLMSRPKPATVLDLGAGKGALIDAACRFWQGIHAITVDNDPLAIRTLSRRARLNPHHTHVSTDGLASDLPELLQDISDKIGAAVCNPPYIRVRHRPALCHLVQDVGLPKEIASTFYIPAEVLFLAQNLRVLISGGQVGMLVPDGFISGESYSRVRKSLCELHRIVTVIELPSGSFSRTEARAHMIVITKGEPQDCDIPIRKLHLNGELSAPVFVSSRDAESRLDYSYLAHRLIAKTNSKTLYLKDVSHSLTRGSFTSAEAKGQRHIFHTSDFGRAVFKTFKPACQVKGQSDRAPIVARAGDILVARVGRNLHEQVCFVRSGSMAITDCIFRLRVPGTLRRAVLRALTSSEGRAFLRSVSRGAGAQYLSRSAILELPIR